MNVLKTLKVESDLILDLLASRFDVREQFAAYKAAKRAYPAKEYAELDTDPEVRAEKEFQRMEREREYYERLQAARLTLISAINESAGAE